MSFDVAAADKQTCRPRNYPIEIITAEEEFIMSKIYTSADQLVGKTPLLELVHIEQAFLLRVVDHRFGNAILYTAGGVKILELTQHPGFKAL